MATQPIKAARPDVLTTIKFQSREDEHAREIACRTKKAEWNDFSAFIDSTALEMCCNAFDSFLRGGQHGSIDDICGEYSSLVRGLKRQYSGSIKIIECEYSGLVFERTTVYQLFFRLFSLLSDVVKTPALLSQVLPNIKLDLHKVLISAHDVFDPGHRAKLMAEAGSIGIEEGMKKEFITRQSNNAKLPRNRGLEPGATKCFAQAVKEESKKRTCATAWSWMRTVAEARTCFREFQIDTCGDNTLEYSYQNGKVRKIKKTTFDRAFNSKK